MFLRFFIVIISTTQLMAAPSKNCESLFDYRVDSISRQKDLTISATEVTEWVNSFQNNVPKEQYECRDVSEIVGAFLCQFQSMTQMNLAFGRISAFVEGLEGIPQGTVVAHTDARLLSLMEIVGGHDLKSEDILRFFESVEKQNDESLKLNEWETTIKDWLRKKLKSSPKMVVITFPTLGGAGLSWPDIVTHEIMHAQYFLTPVMQTTVENFWKTTVEEKDKIAIKQILSDVYSVNEDAVLLVNEFQAYILMNSAETSMLSGYVEKYRTLLWDALISQGVTPIQIQE